MKDYIRRHSFNKVVDILFIGIFVNTFLYVSTAMAWTHLKVDIGMDNLVSIAFGLTGLLSIFNLKLKHKPINYIKSLIYIVSFFYLLLVFIAWYLHNSLQLFLTGQLLLGFLAILHSHIKSYYKNTIKNEINLRDFDSDSSIYMVLGTSIGIILSIYINNLCPFNVITILCFLLWASMFIELILLSKTNHQ